jgi:hypothetical protein
LSVLAARTELVTDLDIDDLTLGHIEWIHELSRIQ